MHAITHDLITLDVLGPIQLAYHPRGAEGIVITADASTPDAALNVYEVDPATSDKLPMFKALVQDSAGNREALYFQAPLTLGSINVDALIAVPTRLHLIGLDSPPSPKGAWTLQTTTDNITGGGSVSYDLDFAAATAYCITASLSNGGQIAMQWGPPAGTLYAYESYINSAPGAAAYLNTPETVAHRYGTLIVNNNDPILPTVVNLHIRARLDIPLA
jgi:hypothetical protein